MKMHEWKQGSHTCARGEGEQTSVTGEQNVLVQCSDNMQYSGNSTTPCLPSLCIRLTLTKNNKKRPAGLPSSNNAKPHSPCGFTNTNTATAPRPQSVQNPPPSTIRPNADSKGNANAKTQNTRTSFQAIWIAGPSESPYPPDFLSSPFDPTPNPVDLFFVPCFAATSSAKLWSSLSSPLSDSNTPR